MTFNGSTADAIPIKPRLHLLSKALVGAPAVTDAAPDGSAGTRWALDHLPWHRIRPSCRPASPLMLSRCLTQSISGITGERAKDPATTALTKRKQTTVTIPIRPQDRSIPLATSTRRAETTSTTTAAIRTVVRNPVGLPTLIRIHCEEIRRIRRRLLLLIPKLWFTDARLRQPQQWSAS